MEHKKRDYTFYLTPETSEKIDAHRILEGKVSRSEFVETAVNFYCGVMDANENRAFLGDEIIKAMRVIVKDMEGRIFSHFRSQDISLSMLAVLFAGNLIGMDKEEIEEMRKTAVEYVDENFRAKSFVTALKEQRAMRDEEESIIAEWTQAVLGRILPKRNNTKRVSLRFLFDVVVDNVIVTDPSDQYDTSDMSDNTGHIALIELTGQGKLKIGIEAKY